MSATEIEPREASEAYVPYTPFQDSYAFEPGASVVPEATVAEAAQFATPFVSEYVGGEPELPETAPLHELLHELYDQEFDETLAELANEAWAAAQNRAEAVGEAVAGTGAEQFLEQWIEPVRDRAEQMLEQIAEAVNETDIASMREDEIDRFVDRFAPASGDLEEHFQDFLGGLLNKAKAFVKKAVSLASHGLMKLPFVGPLLRKLKALVRPLLDRVLKMALDRLPPALRPVARQLARRLLGETAAEDHESAGFETAQATPEVASLQQQFDLDTASLLLAPEPEQQDLLLSEVAAEAGHDEAAPLERLHEAREQFANDLESGVDPRQALENFLPAIMAVQPIARAAIAVIGRSRVVNFLAEFLANMIKRYVPADAARQLSQAIVDTGLRLVSLETPGEAEQQQLATDTLVGAVEDTVGRLAELDEATFESPALLEAATAEAFQQAAAENFPSQLLIPELHEATQHGAWAAMPLGRRRRKYYKKYTRVFDVQLTPQLARSVHTFGGQTLATFLRDQLGVQPPVRARVHLYQAMPGTTLGRIARLERGARGLAVRRPWRMFHPLTREAAALLLHEPGLGRVAAGGGAAARRRIAVGRRYYYLELEGARGAAATTPRRSSEVNVTLDFAKDEFRVAVFLGEHDAQDIAARVRRRDQTGALLAIKRIYEAALASALGGEMSSHVRIQGEALPQEQFVGRIVQRLTTRVRELLARMVTTAVGQGLSDYLTTRASEFVSATEDPRQGVTIVVTLLNPPGAPIVRRLLRGGGISGDLLRNVEAAFAGRPTLTVRTVPGFRVG